MTTEEFHNEFNVLYNYVMSNQGFPFDEYEISVLLTMAQNELVMSLYKGSPITGVAFEGTEESRRYIANLIKNYIPEEDDSYENLLTSYSKAYDLSKDTLMITNEYAIISKEGDECLNGKRIKVIPVTQDEVNTLLDNPFRQPNKYRAFRLDLSTTKVEIISPLDLEYRVRYLKKPEPIILKDLSSEEVSIDGKTKKATSQLDSSLHEMIVKMAVELAKVSYSN